MSQSNEDIIAYYVSLLIQQYCGQTSPQIITFTPAPAGGSFQFTYGTITTSNIGALENQANVQNALSFSWVDLYSNGVYLPYPVTSSGGAVSMQSIIMPATPASGTFVLNYFGHGTSAINYNDSAATIQSELRLLPHLGSCTISGSIDTGLLFEANNSSGSSQSPLYVTSNSLEDVGGNPITPVISSSLILDAGNNTPLIFGFTNNTLQDINDNPVQIVTSGSLVKIAMTIQALSKLTVMNQMPALIQNAFNLIPNWQWFQLAEPANSGTYKLQFAVTSSPSVSTVTTPTINWNDSVQTVQNYINALLPSGTCTVTPVFNVITVNPQNYFPGWSFLFEGVNPTLMSIVDSSLAENSGPVGLTWYNNLAFGTQLDVLAKYAGVSRNGNGPNGSITLSDSDLYTLIQLGIIRNNFGSSLSDIDNLLYTFFQGNIRVFDNAEMQLSYIVNGSYFSSNLLDCILSQGLLPRPMGVQLASIIIVPVVGDFFAFVDAQIPTNRTGPGFEDASGYVLTSPWLDAATDIV